MPHNSRALTENSTSDSFKDLMTREKKKNSIKYRKGVPLKIYRRRAQSIQSYLLRK